MRNVNPLSFALPREMVPSHLIVHLTRVQVHHIFPRERARFPWFVRRANGEIADLRTRIETWPVPL
jgi:hypothetical protein